MTRMADPVLAVNNLDVRFATPDGEVHAVKTVSFEVGQGEVVGVVGESGSGKSQLFLGAVGLLAGNGKATGSVSYRGQELIGASESRLNAIRGSKITMELPTSSGERDDHARVAVAGDGGACHGGAPAARLHHPGSGDDRVAQARRQATDQAVRRRSGLPPAR